MTQSGHISKCSSPHIQVDTKSLLRNAKPKQKLKSDTAAIEMNEEFKAAFEPLMGDTDFNLMDVSSVTLRPSLHF